MNRRIQRRASGPSREERARNNETRMRYQRLLDAGYSAQIAARAAQEPELELEAMIPAPSYDEPVMLIPPNEPEIEPEPEQAATATAELQDWPADPEPQPEPPAPEPSPAPSKPARASRKLTSDPGKIKIPAKWRELGWPGLAAIAEQFTDDPLGSRGDCERIIQAEIERRARG